MILADTGFWLALANRGDAHHARAKAALAKHRGPYATTWPVMTETCHLLATRLGVDAELAFMRSAVAGAFTIFALDRAHLVRAEALMQKYRSLPMDLADASLVILAEESGTGDIFSTDARDFGAYRWKHRKPFKNLLLPLLRPLERRALDRRREHATVALDRQPHRRADDAAQAIADVVGRQIAHVFAVDREDHVAGQQARLRAAEALGRVADDEAPRLLLLHEHGAHRARLGPSARREHDRGREC